MPAIAAPAPCCSTASRSAPAWCRSAQVEGRAVDDRRRPRRQRQAERAAACLPSPWRGAMRHLHAGHADRRRPACCARNRKPSEEEVEDALGGVLCRCTGYRKIIDAVCDVDRSRGAADRRAAVAAVGARLAAARRRRPSSTGSEIFGADAFPADALWLRVVRSPHAMRAFALGDLDGLCAAPSRRRARCSPRRRCPGATASASSRPSPTSRCWPRAMCAFAARRCWRWSATRGDRRAARPRDFPSPGPLSRRSAMRRGGADAGAPRAACRRARTIC